MSLSSSRKTGQTAEAVAEKYLSKKGLKFIDRNYAAAGGEIDLIMRDGNVTVFVEVRFRKSSKYGSASESIDSRKQQRIIRAANHYTQTNPKTLLAPCRFDTVTFNQTLANAQTEWIKNAISIEV